MQRITHATIQLIDIPAMGVRADLAHKMQVRCDEHAKAEVDAAAKLLGLTQSDFLRLAVVKLARAVLAQRYDPASARPGERPEPEMPV